MDFVIILKSLTGRKALCIATFLAAGFLLIPNFYSTPVSHAKSETLLEAPQSFSRLAEIVSPSVVNIRTVKTIKGGGRVFRHFRGPFGQDDRFQDFFDRFLVANNIRILNKEVSVPDLSSIKTVILSRIIMLSKMQTRLR